MGMGFLKMKRKLNIIFVIVLSLFLVSCNSKYGDTSNVEVIKIESIAFISDFIVHDNSKVQSLNEDTYKGWNWILVRNKGKN